MSSVKINLEEMRRLSGMGPSQYPGWSLAEAKAPKPDPDDEHDNTLDHISILDWDDHVRVTRYTVADEARGDNPKYVTMKDLDAALASLKKAKDIDDADIAKIQKAVKAGTVFSKGGGVILGFDRYSGKLTGIDEA